MASHSPLDILKVLPQTNCRDCGEATCLAFASAVIGKRKQLSLCPHLDSVVIDRLSGMVTIQMSVEEKQEERFGALKRRVRDVDLETRAAALGGRYYRGRLTISCLGKEFSVDSQGKIVSQCHTHFWFAIPFLTYILTGRGKEVTGEWISFRNMKDGFNWAPFFDEQCPQKLKRLADSHGELFGDLISVFGATTEEPYQGSDISVVLHPFPKVPMMVCYWKPDDDLQSDLKVFFDRTADQNLGTEAVFGLGTGIVRMLEKLTEKHL